MPNVTLATMKRVDIQPGWVIRQFVKFTFGDEDDGPINFFMPEGNLQVGDSNYMLNPDLLQALFDYDSLVVQKNAQYQDAWQKDGPVTALCDLKDKLYRLHSANSAGAILEWDADKLRGTFFDIWVRDMMCMAWFGLNFKDDDDDRKLDAPDYSERHA